MKTLSIWNVPPQRIKSTKIRLDQLYIHKKTDKELHVACLYNLPSYRSGVIGWCISYLCNLLPKTYLFASLFKKCRPDFRWIDDGHIISRSISYVNGMIPILNIGTWNTKKHFMNFNRENSIFKYGGENNKSMGNLLSSLYYPFYDSGVAILSNVPASASEFVCFDDDDQLNRGILWSYFEAFQTLIMTISTEGRFISTKSDTEMIKLMNLQKNLSEKFVCKNTYIIGDFKREIINFEHETFKIKLVDSSYSPNAYLIHDSRYTVVTDNVVKIMSTMILSPVNLKQNVQIQPPPPPSSPPPSSPTSLATACEESITMTPITVEEVEETRSNNDNTQKNEEEPDVIKKEETHKGILSSLIFNYFSKSPPSKSPPSQSPPSQSPKSDDGWSKV